jgi:tetratricopeptide (TPR) repeat protein
MLVIRGEDAVAAAEEAVRIAPTDADCHRVLARALAYDDRFDQARQAAAYALSLTPGSVPGLLTVAEVERAAGNRGEATAAVRAALAIEPDNTHGRWLLGMLYAERLRVRRSMRVLGDVAREDPARPDVPSMTWPIRGVLRGLRRGLTVGALLICLLLLAGLWWPPAGTFARVLAGVLAAVLAGFAIRILVPAGRLPWRGLPLLPPMMRRANVAGLAVVAAATVLLVVHAAAGWWPATVLALAAGPVLWALGWVELIGAGLDDPGYRHAFGRIIDDLREWWRETKRELRDAWRDGSG